MKWKCVNIILIIFITIACNRSKPIDPVFCWPSSGVAEADSIMLKIERGLTSTCTSTTTDSLIKRFTDLAAVHKDNKLLQIRLAFLQTCYLNSEKGGYSTLYLDSLLSVSDSAAYPFDWNMLKSVKIKREMDLAKKYNMIMDNIYYFKTAGSQLEKGRHMILAGNIMKDLGDSGRAFQYYSEAEKIFQHLGITPYASIAMLNKAVVSPPEVSDSIYASMRCNPDVMANTYTYALVLQNSFIQTDSIQFLELAIDLFNNDEIDKTNLPILLAMKGQYLAFHNKPTQGLEYIKMAFDSIGSKSYPLNYIVAMHDFMADAYYMSGEKDSCIEELDRARILTDSFTKVYNHAGVYAMDAKTRIGLVERNSKLERNQLRIMTFSAILILSTIILILILVFQKKATIKKYEQQLSEEKLEHNRQAIRAQKMVIEESNQLINTIGKKIEEIKTSNDINADSLDNLLKFLKIYRSNEAQRNGFLQVSQEVGVRFMNKLKNDFPTLSESQLRLASLIAAGVDSRQISTMLNIEPASVNKNRYRLRTRLQLTKDQSLEDFLRSYNHLSNP